MLANEGRRIASRNLRPAPTPIREAELEELYRRVFLPLVRRATWNHGLSKEDARDVVQEAFLLAVVKLDAEKNPKAWLIQVVDNLSLNLIRKSARHSRLEARWGLGAGILDREQSFGYRFSEEEGENL